MNIQQDIQDLLDNPQQTVDRQWLNQTMSQYPYFTLPLLLYLKRGGNDPDNQLLARLAIATPDRNTLATHLNRTAQAFARFYPPQIQQTPDTNTTIDRFLDNFGNSSEKEVEAIYNAIFNPQPDYADLLAQQEQQTGTPDLTANNEQDQLINNFIAENLQRQQQPNPMAEHVDEREAQEAAQTPVDQPQPEQDSTFSESLAKSYIATHKFEQALEIIENISANYPEKSIYFADQIRFLKKLIYVQQHKNN